MPPEALARPAPISPSGPDALDQPRGTAMLVDADGNIIRRDASVESSDTPPLSGILTNIVDHGAANAQLASKVRANAVHLAEGTAADKEQSQALIQRAYALETTAQAQTPGVITPDAGDVVARSQADAKRIDPLALTFSDDGRPTHATMSSFIASMPEAEQAQLRTPQGAPTPEAVSRMFGASLVHGYGDEPAFVALRSQATKPVSQNILAGVAEAAGPMSRLSDVGAFDIRAAVRDAKRMAIDATQNGVKLLTLSKRPDIDPAVRPILEFMADNATSQKKIASGLSNLADGLHQ